MARTDYPYDSEPLPYTVQPISYIEVRDFIIKHHYAKGMGQSTTGAFGLYEGASMIGALAFACPVSESVRASVFGPQHVGRVTELSRLVILDVTPRNAESFFIARCLKLLKEQKPHISAVVSFSDPTAGHTGTIYRATNALYYGKSDARRFYLDTTGRLRHQRQCGRNIPLAEALERGWTPTHRQGKFRYCFLLPNENGRHMPAVRLACEPYPKQSSTMNGCLAFDF